MIGPALLFRPRTDKLGVPGCPPIQPACYVPRRSIRGSWRVAYYMKDELGRFWAMPTGLDTTRQRQPRKSRPPTYFISILRHPTGVLASMLDFILRLWNLLVLFVVSSYSRAQQRVIKYLQVLPPAIRKAWSNTCFLVNSWKIIVQITIGSIWLQFRTAHSVGWVPVASRWSCRGSMRSALP